MSLKKKLKELAFNFIDAKNEFNVNFLGKGGLPGGIVSEKYKYVSLTDEELIIVFSNAKSELTEVKITLKDNSLFVAEEKTLEKFPTDGLSDFQLLNSLFDGNAQNLFSDLYAHMLKDEDKNKDETDVVELKRDENRREFQTYLQVENKLPHEAIVRKINTDTFPFNENALFLYNAPKMSSDEFNRCVEIYNRRIPNGDTPMNTTSYMYDLIRLEAPHTDELENLAIDLVRKMYNVPETFDLRAIIKPHHNADEECETPEPDEEISEERKMELIPEIEKRRILNSIVHGCAVHQWTSAYYLVQEELNQIDERLVDKYNIVSASVNYWNWKLDFEPMFEDGQMPMLQGINKVKVAEQKVEASGMNFPVLVHELSKGVMDFLISTGLPNKSKVTPDELKYIYSVADKYSHEQWHYFFGPTLWRAILETSKVESQNLFLIVTEISKMNYSELSKFCISITFDQDDSGKKNMKKLVDSIKNASSI